MYTGFHTFPFFCERPAGETEMGGGRERGRGTVYSVRWSNVCGIDLS